MPGFTLGGEHGATLGGKHRDGLEGLIDIDFRDSTKSVQRQSMPFVGWTPEGTVAPDEVRGDEVTCTECGSKLGVRRSHERDGSFVARHFYHPADTSTCEGGESDLHKRLKSIALSKLRYNFDFKESGKERRIGNNIADVFGIFETPSGDLGKGVVVEVEVENLDKDFVGITRNYFRKGFSVEWVEKADFARRNVELTRFLPYWYGPYYHPHVLDVWWALNRCIREISGDLMEEDGRPRVIDPRELRRLSGTTSYSELDDACKLRLREISRVCRSMEKHDMVEIREDNRIELLTPEEAFQYTKDEGPREQMRNAFKEYEFERRVNS